MALITLLIVIILLLCVKTFYSSVRGCFTNTVLIDVAGIRENYGLTSLASGINYRSDTISSAQYGTSEYSYETSESNDGSGNMTNRRRPDPRYLEDITNNKCWEDICLANSTSVTVPGQSCGQKCSINPGPGYTRTIGGNKLMYNDDMSDPDFKVVQYHDGAIYVPWSDLYNNIMPANPTIR